MTREVSRPDPVESATAGTRLRPWELKRVVRTAGAASALFTAVWMFTFHFYEGARVDYLGFRYESQKTGAGDEQVLNITRSNPLQAIIVPLVAWLAVERLVRLRFFAGLRSAGFLQHRQAAAVVLAFAAIHFAGDLAEHFRVWAYGRIPAMFGTLFGLAAAGWVLVDGWAYLQDKLERIGTRVVQLTAFKADLMSMLKLSFRSTVILLASILVGLGKLILDAKLVEEVKYYQLGVLVSGFALAGVLFFAWYIIPILDLHNRTDDLLIAAEQAPPS